MFSEDLVAALGSKKISQEGGHGEILAAQELVDAQKALVDQGVGRFG